MTGVFFDIATQELIWLPRTEKACIPFQAEVPFLKSGVGSYFPANRDCGCNAIFWTFLLTTCKTTDSSRDAYTDMVRDNPWADNKELLLIPGAVHTDLYDRKDVIPFDRIEQFFRMYLK